MSPFLSIFPSPTPCVLEPAFLVPDCHQPTVESLLRPSPWGLVPWQSGGDKGQSTGSWGHWGATRFSSLGKERARELLSLRVT
jgi:hypothetical protein